MVLTAENYYSREANEEYMSVSQYKDFAGTYGKMACEFTAMEKLNERWEEPKSKALMVGSYVDSYFEGTLDSFKANNPDLFKRDGGLKAEYVKADEIIERIERGITFKNGSLTVGFCNKAKTYGFADFYEKTVECGVMNSDGYIIVNLPISLGINTVDLFREWNKECYIIKELSTPIEIDLTAEEIEAFKELSAYYPITNISVASDQLDGYAVFNYPVSMANGWNYVKQQLNDNRDYIYDMDLQSAEAYVNSEYAVALTELEV